ncbi:MAG TPA: Calx-beta domain-containing protein, partial [Candidatus Binatia bacterium]|nr:Calx-beta domain-containing protein [Candidatus Binatia bacterium]
TAQVDVTWQTADSTATVADSDYVPDSTTVSFAPGATTGTITVHVNGDLTPEDPETFLVRLSNPVNAGIDDGEGVGTILNDDNVTGVDGLSLREVSFAVQGGNPAGDGVSFRIGLPSATRAEVSVYDIAGRRVAQPLSEFLPAGYRTVRWNVRRGTGAAGSGVYFVRFSAQGKTMIRKFVLLR